MRGFLDKETRLSEKERRNLSILDYIRRAGEISRAEISRLSDLNIVTVSNYVTKYVRDKIVFETGLDISSGGRRPELLRLNPEHGYAVGVDLGAPQLVMDTSLIVILTDLSGKIIAKEKIKKEKESFDLLSDKVLEAVDKVIKTARISKDLVRGIGVGIWGVIDRYREMVRYAVEEEAIVRYTSLLDRLEASYNVPVMVEHDAALGAFGEKWSGIGAISDADNIVFMCSDSSCGLVIKGELYYGASKSAGELNLNPPDSEAAREDNKCWTNYSFGCCMRSRGLDLDIPGKFAVIAKPEADSVIANPGEARVKQSQPMGLSEIIKLAENGDESAKKVINDAGEYLGVKIAFLINLFNPEVIVIGRGMENGGDLFFSSVRKSVRRWAYEESAKVAKILPASLGENAIASGAAALVVQDFFAKV